MSTIENRVMELRRDPTHWSQYDEATRELLKQQRDEVTERIEFKRDELVMGCPKVIG